METHVKPAQLRESWLAAKVISLSVPDPVEFPLTVTMTKRNIEMLLGRSETVTLQVIETPSCWIAFGPIHRRYVLARGEGLSVDNVSLRQIDDLAALPERVWPDARAD